MHRCLVNNAGASFGAPPLPTRTTKEAWMKTIDINLHGTFRVSKAVFPIMTRKPAAIVNIASRPGKLPPWPTGLCSRQGRSNYANQSHGPELSKQGVRVNAICPGIIMTDLQVFRFQMEAKFLNQTPAEREKAWANDIPWDGLGPLRSR